MHQHNALSMKQLLRSKMRALLLSVLLPLGLTSYLHGATLWVTSAADAGSGSLRQALLDATAGDSIRFDASLDGTPIVLSSALAALQPVVVKGNGMAKTIVTTNANDRLFIVPFISAGSYALEDLSLLNAAPSGVTAVGGAILCNAGSLTLHGVKMDGNTSLGSGGAVFFESNGTLRMEGCIVSNNQAVEGGGVFVSSGTFPLSYSPKVEIENCSFHHNTATGSSSITAADLAHLGDELMVRNSTFAEGDAVNAVFVEGGSFGLARSFESTTITACTGVGLGTCQALTLTNCLLAGNTGVDFDNACSSSITGSNNLIQTAAFFSAGSIGLTGVDAKLETLSDAGNGAMVAYPAICSPAVDAGAAGLGNDQLNNAPVGVRDIGAVEQLRLVPNVRASNAVGGSVNIFWDSPAGTALCPTLPSGLNIEILRDGTFIGLPASPTATSFVDPFPQEGFQTYSAVTTLGGIRGGAIEVLGRQAPNRSITGFVTNNAGSPVQNVQVCAFDSTQQGALMADPDGNGVGGYLSQPLDMGPDGTIAVWLHRNDWSSTPSGATFSGIVGSSEAFRMLLDHATKELYVFYGPLFGSGTIFSLPSDTFSPGWHHLGLTWDSEGGSVAFTLYLDGDTAYHQSGTPTFTEAESVWTLGGANSLLGIPFSPWPGMMDELQIYDAAKGAEFFRRFRRNIPEPSAPNLKLYYPFDPIATADGLLWPNHAQSAETQMAEQIGFLTNGAGMGVEAGHCALTDATGNYAITPLDLQGLNYTVRPVEENRFYDPALAAGQQQFQYRKELPGHHFLCGTWAGGSVRYLLRIGQRQNRGNRTGRFAGELHLYGSGRQLEFCGAVRRQLDLYADPRRTIHQPCLCTGSKDLVCGRRPAGRQLQRHLHQPSTRLLPWNLPRRLWTRYHAAPQRLYRLGSVYRPHPRPLLQPELHNGRHQPVGLAGSCHRRRSGFGTSVQSCAIRWQLLVQRIHRCPHRRPRHPQPGGRLRHCTRYQRLFPVPSGSGPRGR